jgi:hypothetical protein
MNLQVANIGWWKSVSMTDEKTLYGFWRRRPINLDSLILREIRAIRTSVL